MYTMIYMKASCKDTHTDCDLYLSLQSGKAHAQVLKAILPPLLMFQ